MKKPGLERGPGFFVLADAQSGGQTRAQGLEQRLRTLLIVVNGKTTSADLVKQFGQLGDVQPLLECLIAQGYVREAAVSAAVDFREVRLRLSHALTDAMGPAGDAIASQLEGCQSAVRCVPS